MRVVYRDNICSITTSEYVSDTQHYYIRSELSSLKTFGKTIVFTRMTEEEIVLAFKKFLVNVLTDCRSLVYCTEHGLSTITPEMDERFSLSYEEIPIYAHYFTQVTAIPFKGHS